MLLNPGSYMRLGENSEFELADSSLDNLEVRLIRGTAIVEATGADDTELLINITTPHTRMAIVRRGLYRVNVVPGDTTELIVRKGRVMLDGSHVKVKGGNKVIFNSNSFFVAKLEKADKKKGESLESWSEERAETLAKANRKLSGRTLTAFISSFGNDWWSLSGLWGRSGVWLYSPGASCYTFLPFYYGWGSPYGGYYSRYFYGGPCCGRVIYGGTTIVGPTTGGSTPGGSIGLGSGGAAPHNPAVAPSSPRFPDSPMSGHGKPDLTPDAPATRHPRPR
jgi:hypothetical protein